jgi:hypothetical protein
MFIGSAPVWKSDLDQLCNLKPPAKKAFSQDLVTWS